MTAAEARQILRLRRGPADDADPQMAAALEVARQDPELAAWLREQESFHATARATLRQLPVPPGLAARVRAAAATAATAAPTAASAPTADSPASLLPLPEAKTARPGPGPQDLEMGTVPLPWWQRFPAWTAATAAAAVLMLGLFLFRQQPAGGDDDTFDTYRSRMVRSVLRQYQMDLETNTLAGVRQFLAARQAPSDFPLRASLEKLPALGAGLQSWQGHAVSMVCLDSGGQGTAILFVVDATSVRQPPPPTPHLAQVSRRLTASWTDQGRTYLLLLDNDTVAPATLQKYL
jgi:hypothetical protein